MASPSPILLLGLLLPLVAAPSALAKDFWNIDCGGNGSGPSENRPAFEGDGSYVRGGVSGEIWYNNYSVTDPELRTVRSFPGPKKKNCYTIPVEKGAKVLVRVLFNYGNYDGKGRPPKFEVHLDGNDWCSVATDMGNTSWCEAVYVTRMDGATGICFGRSDDQYDPFANAIQVLRLKPGMYMDLDYSKYILHLLGRFAYGANETETPVIRYPDDAYDRKWFPTTDDQYKTLKNIATAAVNTTESSKGNYPPEKIFQSAMEPNSISNLTLSFSYLPGSTVQIYIAMYFTEVPDPTGESGVRSFDIYLDGKLQATEVVPQSGRSLELDGVFNATSNTVLKLVQAKGSTLPPIISGMEVLKLSGGLNDGTHREDVKILSLLQRHFEILQEWDGDPCLPMGYNWEWVRCNFDDPPRITKLFLSGLDLSGELIDFTPLDAILTIDLHNNKFSGAIPEFLGKFPNLEVLNLADNDFSSIPNWLSANKKILVNVTGNPKLCNSGEFCFLPSLSEQPTVLGAETPALPPSESCRFVASLFWFHIVFVFTMVSA